VARTVEVVLVIDVKVVTTVPEPLDELENGTKKMVAAPMATMIMVPSRITTSTVDMALRASPPSGSMVWRLDTPSH
jgi:hypothetical protein